VVAAQFNHSVKMSLLTPPPPFNGSALEVQASAAALQRFVFRGPLRTDIAARPRRPPQRAVAASVAISQLPTVVISARDLATRKYFLREQKDRARLNALTKQGQEAHNLRSGAVPVSEGEGHIAAGNSFSVLRQTQFDREEKYPARDESGVPVAPPMHVAAEVPQAPDMHVPRRFRQDVVARREILRVRAALRPVVPVVPIAPGLPRQVVVPRDLVTARSRLRHVAAEVVVVEAVQSAPAREAPRPRVDPTEVLAPRDPDEEGPGNQIVGYRDRRLLNTTFKEYKFDQLDFIGKWNSSRTGNKFVKHFGFHFNEREIVVRLPASLVREMMDWWTNRDRDAAWENYQLSEARCRVLVSELAISASEQYYANLYGPALGFLRSWDRQQNVSRVVEGAHVDLRLYTVPKLRRSYRTKFGKGAMAGVLLAATVVVGIVALRVRVVPRARLQLLAEDAIVQATNLCGRIAMALVGLKWTVPSLPVIKVEVVHTASAGPLSF
jgi:hypothetical protein